MTDATVAERPAFAERRPRPTDISVRVLRDLVRHEFSKSPLARQLLTERLGIAAATRLLGTTWPITLEPLAIALALLDVDFDSLTMRPLQPVRI